MIPTAAPGTVVEISTAELKDHMDHAHESEFVLVDVRQPEEYQQGHIPGAVLIPLGELASRQGELEQHRGKQLVFCCRSGARSGRAAAWASASLELPSVYNLVGGFLAWRGLALPNFPRAKAIHLEGGIEAMLEQAFNLEKGTHVLYEILAKEFTDGPVAKVIAAVSEAEVSHARQVHSLLVKFSEKPKQDFDVAFAAAPGDLVESGESYEAILQRAKALGQHGPPALLELILEIELNAYELYKSVLSAAPSEAMKGALAELAQEEKKHAAAVLKALEQL